MQFNKTLTMRDLVGDNKFSILNDLDIMVDKGGYNKSITAMPVQKNKMMMNSLIEGNKFISPNKQHFSKIIPSIISKNCKLLCLINFLEEVNHSVESIDSNNITNHSPKNDLNNLT